MKKTVLFLFPDKFTHFEYCKYELAQLEKKYNLKVIINDLSNLLNNKKLNSVWKSQRYQKALFFQSMTRWVRFFNKIKKKDIIILHFSGHICNFNGFIIKLCIKLSKKPVFFYKESNPEIKNKKNISWFVSKFCQHNINYKVYFFYLKDYFFRFLMNFIKCEKNFTLFSDYKNNINDKKNSIVKINFFDYSNSLLFVNSRKKTKKKYIIYLDDGGPYFTGDTHLTGGKLPDYDIKGWYKDLFIFFDKLENYFNANVIIIPHPKYKSLNKKIKSFNPYFKNHIVNNDSEALGKLSANAFFFISTGSMAVAYAVAHNKPVICMSSSNHTYDIGEKKNLLDQAKLLGCKPFDIVKLGANKIHKFLKVNKSKYCDYKYRYLTSKSGKIERKPNYKIIGDFISKQI